MKINQIQNADSFTASAQKTEEGSKGTKANGKGTNIKGSELNLMSDDIWNRKQKAQKSAMDLLRNQFESDGMIDHSLAEKRDLITKKRELADEALQNFNKLSDYQQKIKEEYGITDDSQEQQDLELRLKAMEAQKPGSDVKLTQDEIKHLDEMASMTEYQEKYMSVEGQKGLYHEQMEKANEDIIGITRVINAINFELLKYHGMVDAENGADKILEAASDETIVNLINEAKDHVEEEQKEVEAKAEEVKEKKEEEQAIREENRPENDSEKKATEIMTDVKEIQTEVEAMIKKLLEEKKLLGEDIKGIDVDLVY